MRRVALALILLTGVGCKTLHPKDCADGGAGCNTAGSSFGSAPCGPGGGLVAGQGSKAPCAQGQQVVQQQPCNQQGCQPCKKPCEQPEKREAPQPKPGPPEEQPSPRQAIVTQDIMLIPRMVYVPYAPQVPVAPARLGYVTPGANQMERDICPPCPTQPREGPTQEKEKPKEAPCSPRDKQLMDTLDRATQLMQQMEQRISALEARTTAVAEPCPAPGGPRLRHGPLKPPLIPPCEPAN